MPSIRELNTNNRLLICKNCPIYVLGVCSSSLWINPNTEEISTSAKSGYHRGCGCVCSIKVKNPTNHCIIGKW